MATKLVIVPFLNDDRANLKPGCVRTLRVLVTDGNGVPLVGVPVDGAFIGDCSHAFASQRAYHRVEGDKICGVTNAVTNSHGQVYFSFIAGIVEELVPVNFSANGVFLSAPILVSNEDLS